jgi:hypothetical protein
MDLTPELLEEYRNEIRAKLKLSRTTEISLIVLLNYYMFDKQLQMLKELKDQLNYQNELLVSINKSIESVESEIIRIGHVLRNLNDDDAG